MPSVFKNPDGVLRTVRVDIRIPRDTVPCTEITVFYKGVPLTKVQAIELMLAPSEHDIGNQMLLDDLGVKYDKEETQ